MSDDHNCPVARRKEFHCPWFEKEKQMITALRAEVERLRVQNIQMQAALGYGIVAEDERHILPSNPYKCGTCDANKHIRAENERLSRDYQTARDAHDALLVVNEKLRAALDLYREAVRIDATMEGPKFMGSNASALKRAWDADRAALTPVPVRTDSRYNNAERIFGDA